MPKTPTTAVILAAGLGSRLRGMHDAPKGLLALGGVTLMQRSIDAIHAAGISDLVVVTGCRAEAYQDFFAVHAPSVQLVHNPDFARTGSMHSLWLARSAVRSDFLLLESDLLFEARALAALLESPRDALLLSGTTHQGDEVHAIGRARPPGGPSAPSVLQVESGPPGGRALPLLAKLTKRLSESETSVGEFTGISRVSRELHAAMCRHYETRVTFPSNYHYDDCFTDVSASHPISLVTIPDLWWAEVDNPAQYERAVRHVLPALTRQSSVHARA